ncbi:hypothetical protein Rsub_00741 [Raphidocelis subcapitata]|uniref:Apple domain-containing protein n=1 Tax=Raphidocelis subcapitata TaxID=307507 RepID=A0A2V0NLP1_9CHLO|nr:hypothetical protein Rsub_00741 [Raphidocelis subcapitata]|eukprot:GBF88029.1 hypothetical protein Rsub_00741 [Raphidocelis subcapitata]
MGLPREPRARRLACALLLIAFAACSPAAAADACAQQPGVMGGDFMVVSLNSMFAPRLPTLTAFTPAECCAACRASDGCNAWSFCADPKGCGKEGACNAYSDANPKLHLKSLETMGLDRFKFPQKAFGPWADGNGCALDGRWAFSTCSLKVVQDTKSPPLTTGDDGAGWVSGVVAQPAVKGCPSGLNKATCDACRASKNPRVCFACAQKPQVIGGNAKECAACASLQTEAQRDACVGCVADFTPSLGCGSCVYWGEGGKVDEKKTGQCFDCVVAAGAPNRRSAACSACFFSPNGHAINTAACLSCASDARRGAPAREGCGPCNDGEVSDPGGCLACAAGADTYDKAVACASCSHRDMAGFKGDCYSCIKTVGAGPPSYCANMGQTGSNDIAATAVSVASDYFTCVAATAKLSSGAAGCNACVKLPTAAAAKACLACRTGQQTDAGGWCASCWMGGKEGEAKKCQDCLARFNDGQQAFNMCFS